MWHARQPMNSYSFIMSSRRLIDMLNMINLISKKSGKSTFPYYILILNSYNLNFIFFKYFLSSDFLTSCHSFAVKVALFNLFHYILKSLSILSLLFSLHCIFPFSLGLLLINTVRYHHMSFVNSCCLCIFCLHTIYYLQHTV